MKEEILRILKNSEDFVSGEKISEEFAMTRANIWKYINMLKEDGYEIESLPRRGYRLVSSPDILSYGEIEAYLETDLIGRRTYYYDSIDSTSKKARELAPLEEEGTIIIAEEQGEGKGRMGRSWISPKGKGIWMSLILKPQLNPSKLSGLTLLAAAALHQALEKMGIESRIKWPNDILIGDKKIAGILTEMSGEMDRVNYIIMGIGINVNLEEEDLPEELRRKATSIRIAQGEKINRQELLAHILNGFEEFYMDFKDEGAMERAIEICRENSALLNREVRIIKSGESRLGRALDIDPEGQLLVEFPDGQIERIYSGEISVRGRDGYV